MTLRETIAYIITRDSVDLNCTYKKTADAILAAIRTHMTSPEAVERACDSSRAFNPDMDANWTEVWVAEDVEHFRKLTRAAILAALEDS
jgi:hypothetical protein